MAIKFNHRGLILALRDGFPKYYEMFTSIKVKWGKDFAEYDFRSAYSTGTGKNEKLILPTEISGKSKSIPVAFIEDAEGALTIKLNEIKVYVVKPTGRISQRLIKTFTKFIIKENL